MDISEEMLAMEWLNGERIWIKIENGAVVQVIGSDGIDVTGDFLYDCGEIYRELKRRKAE